MATEHNTLTGSSLHEPKGAATAAAGTRYEADGAGSGSWLAPPTSVHAAATVSGNATETTISTSDTWTEFAVTWTSVDADGVTISGNSFVIDEAGSYFITANLSSLGVAAGSDTFAYTFAINGTPISQQTRRTISSATDTGAVGVQGYLADLSVSDVVKLYMKNETDTTNGLITDFNVFITMVNRA